MKNSEREIPDAQEIKTMNLTSNVKINTKILSA